MAIMKFLLCYLFLSVEYYLILSETDTRDAGVLLLLRDQWQNIPPSWNNSDDPCGTFWEGVTCNTSRVTQLSLSTMGLSGTLSSNIGGLTELTLLDLSFNPSLTGPLPPELGNLPKLNILVLAGCSFSGNIPSELGNLTQLSFLALNSNKLTGGIPSSLGNLSNLYWLDLSDNQLTGSIPVSTSVAPGLDLLKEAKHFHFQKNQLSGVIPEKLFSSDMVLIHVLLDGNKFTGEIPISLGLLQTLEVLRLDENSLINSVPNLKNLTNLNELNLAGNQLSGPLPDLSGMVNLNFVDLSANTFQPSQLPAWLLSLQSLTTLVIEQGSLEGEIPEGLFSLPQIQLVNLQNNSLNGTVEMGSNISRQLQFVDLANNDISSLVLGSGYNHTLILTGNPICNGTFANTTYCQQSAKSCATSLVKCGKKTCSTDEKMNPQNCTCTHPYEGTFFFRAPSFRNLSDCYYFHSLETSLSDKLGLIPGAVSLQNLFFNTDDYLQVGIKLFPSEGVYFNASEIQRIGFSLSNQTFKPPEEFGPYYFVADPYTFPGPLVR